MSGQLRIMDNLNLEGIIEKSFKDHIETLSYVNSKQFYEKFANSIKTIYETLENGGCIFTCGNGGSFSDAQHFTAELVVKYKRDRSPLSSITLGSNFSNLSACANDYSFEEIFKREYMALSNDKDTLIAISTSGNSRNIRKIVDYANYLERSWILVTSDKIENKPEGGIVLDFPFTTTAAVQEAHIFTLQLICRSIDDLIIGVEKN